MRVLRIANSLFYGLGGRIDNIKDACIVLGVHTTRNIVLAAGTINHLASSGKSNGLNLLALWRHGVGTGIAAKTLAKNVHVNPETVFTAGLLHDLGKVILDIYFPSDYTKVIAYRDKQNCLLRDAENVVLGFDHALVGARIARRWSLPVSIADTIRDHHSINIDITSKEANLILVADIISRGLEIGDPGDSLVPTIDPVVLQRLELDIPMIEQYFHEIEHQQQLLDGLLAD